MGAESERVGLAQASPPGGSCGVGPGYVCRALRAALEVSGARSSPRRGDSRARGRVLRRIRGLAGTFLLNPEGFRHAPFSEPGCILFVKLRQFAGRERSHVVVDTHKLAWEPSALPAVAYKALYQQTGFSDVMRLERWEPQAD